MKDSDFLDLANRVIDGVGSEHDREALEAVMHDSTQRRLEYDQLSALASILNAVRPVDPPADLRERILASLPLKAENEPISWVSTTWASILDTIRARPRTSMAYAVVSGLIVGVIAFGALSGTIRTDNANVFGTMSDYRSEEGFAIIDQAELQASGFDASLTLVTSSDAFRVEIDLKSDAPVDVEMSIQPEARRWAGILRADGSTDFNAVVGASTVALSRLQSGQYAFVGSMGDRVAEESKIEATFSAEGSVLGQATLSFAP